jgi:regulator of cell morphogenesis and NO signaling
MNTVGWKNKRIGDLVEENYVHASVLFYFGINFYDYSTLTLEQVCSKKGLRVEQIIRELEAPSHLQASDLPLVSYPIDLILEYLKHTHFIFIKHKLPYMAGLVQAFSANHERYTLIEKDLKVVFPLFVEDFIHHIYEEEDTLFTYIRALERAAKGQYNPTRLFYRLEKNSIQQFASEHDSHDDEMMGIRNITSNYSTDPSTPLHIRVMYNELKSFEQSLAVHARIENEILFPRAMALERKVKALYFDRAKWN